MSSPRSRWGPIRSLLALSPVLLGAPLWGLKQHYGMQTLSDFYGDGNSLRLLFFSS